MSKTANKAEMESRARGTGDSPGETVEQLNERQAAASGKPPVEKAEVKFLPLSVNRVQQAEIGHNDWDVTVDHGIQPANVLETSFWQHHTKTIRIGDEIRVTAADGSFVMWLYVQNVGPRDIKVAQVGEVLKLDPFDPNELKVPSGYDVNYGGGIDKWRVSRGTEVLKSGFEQESLARRWLANHIEAMAR